MADFATIVAEMTGVVESAAIPLLQNPIRNIDAIVSAVTVIVTKNIDTAGIATVIEETEIGTTTDAGSVSHAAGATSAIAALPNQRKPPSRKSRSLSSNLSPKDR